MLQARRCGKGPSDDCNLQSGSALLVAFLEVPIKQQTAAAHDSETSNVPLCTALSPDLRSCLFRFYASISRESAAHCLSRLPFWCDVAVSPP